MVQIETPRSRPSWASEWDPHPLCWLSGILRNRYGHGTSHRDTAHGIALTAGKRGPEVVLVPREPRSKLLYDVRSLDEERTFGCLLWTGLARLARSSDESAFRLPNGIELPIRGTYGTAHVVETPDGYVVHASEWLADLPALGQVAKVLDRAIRHPGQALDNDPDYWRHDEDAPFAVLLSVLTELRQPSLAHDLSTKLAETPRLKLGASERLRQFKPQLRQALRNPSLVPEKAVRRATETTAGDPVLDGLDPHRMFARLWQKLYPDEPLP